MISCWWLRMLLRLWLAQWEEVLRLASDVCREQGRRKRQLARNSLPSLLSVPVPGALPLIFYMTCGLGFPSSPYPTWALETPHGVTFSCENGALHSGPPSVQHFLFQMCPAIDAVLVYVNKKWASLNGV